MTKGEYRVGISFNPGGHPEVNKIKRACADLIDLLEAYVDPSFGEKNRLIAMAQTDIEVASMNGVKAVTKEPQT